MTPLGEQIKRLKEAQLRQRAECGQLIRIAAKELAEKLSALFDATLTKTETDDEPELAKVVSLKQPGVICVITHVGAELRVDLNLYKEGLLKDIDDIARAIFLDMTASILEDKYPEYQVRRNGKDIHITEPPPPPMTFMEWLRSLFKPRELT